MQIEDNDNPLSALFHKVCQSPVQVGRTVRVD